MSDQYDSSVSYDCIAVGLYIYNNSPFHAYCSEHSIFKSPSKFLGVKFIGVFVSLGLKLKSERIAALNDMTERHSRELDNIKEAHSKAMNVGL